MGWERPVDEVDLESLSEEQRWRLLRSDAPFLFPEAERGRRVVHRLRLLVRCAACGVLEVERRILRYEERCDDGGAERLGVVRVPPDPGDYAELYAKESSACGDWTTDHRTVVATPTALPPGCPDCAGPLAAADAEDALRGEPGDFPLTIYDRWVEGAPGAALPLSERARARGRRGDAAGALADLERALAADPAHARADGLRWSALGYALELATEVALRPSDGPASRLDDAATLAALREEVLVALLSVADLPPEPGAGTPRGELVFSRAGDRPEVRVRVGTDRLEVTGPDGASRSGPLLERVAELAARWS